MLRRIFAVNKQAMVVRIISICEDIGQMVSRCRGIYMADDSIPIPYKQANDSLMNNDVAKFLSST